MTSNVIQKRRRCGIYVRISMDVAGEGLGVERQRKDCVAKAESISWDVIDIYEDNDVSASKVKISRPAFDRMMEDLRSGRIDALVVYDLDRFTRQPAELETFIPFAEQFNIMLANVSGDVDLATADGRLMARMKGAMAAREAERMGERVARQAQQWAEKGIPHKGRFRPFGYTKDYEIIPAEAQLLHEAYGRVLMGESLGVITKDWNARGITTVSGLLWRRGTLAQSLRKPLYVGLREWKGEVIGKGNWTGIIDQGTYDRYLEVCAETRSRYPTAEMGSRPRKHLLTGIAKCGLCGSGMMPVRLINRNLALVLACRKNNLGCGRVSRASEPVEALVVETFLRDAERESIKTVVTSGRDYGAEAAGLSRQIENLQRAHQAGDLELQDFIMFVKPLRHDLKRIMAEEAKVSNQQKHFVTDVRRKWEDPATTLAKKRLMLNERIHGVVILPATRRGPNAFDPACVKILWRD